MIQEYHLQPMSKADHVNKAYKSVQRSETWKFGSETDVIPGQRVNFILANHQSESVKRTYESSDIKKNEQFSCRRMDDIIIPNNYQSPIKSGLLIEYQTEDRISGIVHRRIGYQGDR